MDSPASRRIFWQHVGTAAGAARVLEGAGIAPIVEQETRPNVGPIPPEQDVSPSYPPATMAIEPYKWTGYIRTARASRGRRACFS